jgi:surface antigen
MNCKLVTAMVTATAIVAIVTPASAQLVSPFGKTASNTGLSREDLNLMRKAMRDALNEYRPGASTTWTSKSSGRAGKATVVQVFDQKGMKCAQLTHEFTKGPGNTYSAPMCKDSMDGSWKIAF